MAQQQDWFDQFDDDDESFFDQFEDEPIETIPNVELEAKRPQTQPVVTEPVMEKPEPPNFLERAWEVANTPLVSTPEAVTSFAEGIDAPTADTEPGFLAKLKGFGAGATKGVADLVSGLTTPLNLATTVATGGASLAGKAGLSGAAKGLSAAAKALSVPQAVHGGFEMLAPDRTPIERITGATELGAGIAGMRGNVKPTPKPTPKPAIAQADLDAASTLIRNSGFDPASLTPEQIIEFGQKLKPTGTNLGQTASNVPTLPRALAGAKPKYNIADSSYNPQFASDVDKALFIISQSTKSKADADYLKFAMDATGLNENETRALGRALKSNIKNTVMNQEPGDVSIPQFWKPKAPPKPKLKMVFNPQKNGLEPDLNDPATAEAFAKMQSGPTPNSQRVSPDKEIPVPQLEEVDLTPETSKKKPRELSLTQEVLAIPRAMQSTYDLSFPFRQGLGLIHTKGWWKSWDGMIRSYGSEASYQGLMDSISERPNFKPNFIVKDGKVVPGKSLAERAGLQVTDLKGMREEELSSAWVEKNIPGVRASSRAYNAFANKLRADTFDSLVTQAQGMGLDPNRDEILAKQIANFVNNATGRGDLGSLSKAADTLNNVMFSPRLMASRIQMMNPANYVYGNKLVRKQYLKSMMATAIAWTTMAGMAKMAGADVNLDPTNSDFGKIKFGDTRLDPGAGFQQYLVLATRLASGKFTSSTTGKTKEYGEGYGTPTRLDALGDFIQNKLAPIPSYGARMFNASSRRPFYVGEETAKLFVPIILQDMSELWQENPEAMPFALPANFFGIGSNTYNNQPQSRFLGWPEEMDFRIPSRR